MYFQELFIWLAPEYHLSQLIDAPGESCWLLGALWALIVALGGSWRKYMKTIVLLSKTYIFHPQGYSERFPRLIFWIIPNAWRLSFCRLLDPRPKNHQIKPHGTGFDDLAQYYIRRTFYYRIIVHWITCSWVPCLLTEPAGHPRKKCVYTKLFP